MRGRKRKPHQRIIRNNLKKTEKQGKGGSNSENSAYFFLLQAIVMCPKMSFILVTLPLPEKKENERKSGKKLFTSDPVPELEHVGLVDAELLHLRRVGGQRGKVLGHMRFL
jgi:hypothetical protein